MLSRVFLVGALSFPLGILLGSLTTPSIGWLLGLLGLATLLFAAFTRTIYVYIGVALLLCALGLIRTSYAPTTLPSEFVPLLSTQVSLEGRIVADPDQRETHQRVTIEVNRDDVHTRVLAVAPLYPSLRYGEGVTVQGKMVLPEPFATDGGRVFRYDQFLAKDGVFAVIERASVEVTAPRDTPYTHVRGALSDVKSSFLAWLTVALPEPHASLAGGLIAGGKQGLGTTLLDMFIVTGLIHIVVLSGYNVMIVAEGVLRALSVFPRRIAVWAAGVTLAAFVLAAGAGPASIRAGLMAGIALFARATYRTYDALRALVLAGVVMLLWNPLLLLHDPGFQLSFIATVGLIVGTPILTPMLEGIRSIFLRDIVSATLAAQIAVLPLLLYQNGLFSVVALPANILVLPIVPLAMAAGALAGLGGALVPALAPLFGIPAYFLLSYIIVIVEYASALPFAAFSISAFPFIYTLIAYVGLGYLIWKYRDRITGSPSSSVHQQLSS
ncbi:ComEC family competence protein [Patescibacteria group bacterium]|nr:ComEC family competence protein [Patescibacteria group bacterium]